MDQETNNRVLKCLLDNEDFCNNSHPLARVQKILPDLSEKIIEAALYDLEKNGCLAIKEADATIYYITLNSSAHGYFREKAEAKRLQDQAKAETRQWELYKIKIQFGYGFAAGMASTLIVQFLVKQF